MLIDGDRIRLGYPGDGGLGSRLAKDVAEGHKTSTCLPAAEMTPAELEHALGAVGRTCEVIDPDGRVWCRVVVTDAYLATFREPSDALLRGEGYGEGAARFQVDHVAPAAPWIVAGVDLSEDAAWSLARLAPEYRLVVTLHDGLLWTVPDIAAATGLSVEVIRQRLRRGRMRLAAPGRRVDGTWAERHRGVVAVMQALGESLLRDMTPPGGRTSEGQQKGNGTIADSLEVELTTSAALGEPAVLHGSICVLLFSLLPAEGAGS